MHTKKLFYLLKYVLIKSLFQPIFNLLDMSRKSFPIFTQLKRHKNKKTCKVAHCNLMLWFCLTLHILLDYVIKVSFHTK